MKNSDGPALLPSDFQRDRLFRHRDSGAEAGRPKRLASTERFRRDVCFGRLGHDHCGECHCKKGRGTIPQAAIHSASHQAVLPRNQSSLLLVPASTGLWQPRTVSLAKSSVTSFVTPFHQGRFTLKAFPGCQAAFPCRLCSVVAVPCWPLRVSPAASGACESRLPERRLPDEVAGFGLDGRAREDSFILGEDSLQLT